ncbi:unnamed protein product, partial [Vitis vinifera]
MTRPPHIRLHNTILHLNTRREQILYFMNHTYKQINTCYFPACIVYFWLQKP